jgi:hypothetical protein
VMVGEAAAGTSRQTSAGLSSSIESNGAEERVFKAIISASTPSSVLDVSGTGLTR